MASANTTTQALLDSQPTIVSSARRVSEYEGVMPQLADSYRLGEGIGTDWKEVSFAKLDAQAITDSTILDNPQQLSDTPFVVTPTMIGIHTLITWRVGARLSKNAFGQIGPLAQNAMQRKKDIDGLTVLDGAAVSQPGAGNTLTTGVISAMGAQVKFGQGVEPSNPPHYGVLHSYQLRDLFDEMTAGIGTYPIPEGETARVFREGFSGMIDQIKIFRDDLITIDGSSDSKGGVFAKRAVCLVQGRALKTFVRERPDVGGGSTEMFLYDEYAYGERSPGNWLAEIYSDATAPTS